MQTKLILRRRAPSWKGTTKSKHVEVAQTRIDASRMRKILCSLVRGFWRKTSHARAQKQNMVERGIKIQTFIVDLV